jgi:predicted transcriptional regulator YdeE
MKIVKYVFLLLLLAVVAVTVFIATQEGRYDIKKERIIKVPKTVLYNYINEYRNWENVGILTGNDTTAVFAYSEKTSGEGALLSWKKEGTNGEVKTVRLVENDSIIQNAVIDNLNSEIYWSFKDTLKSTKISLRMKGQLSFTEKAYAVLKGGVEEKIESALESGLDNLDTFLVHELAVFNVEVKGLVTKRGVFYLGHAITCKISDIGKKAGEAFPKLTTFIKNNKIATDGAPFLLYKKFDKQLGTTSFLVCVPIKEEIFTSPGSDFEGGKLAPFKALKTTLKGDYSHLEKAWDAADKDIADKALQENTTGTYVEVYTKGIQQTKKPSEWVTDIYIPIGRPAIATVQENAPATAVVPAGAVTTPPTTRSSAATGTTAKPTVAKPATGAVKPPVTKPSAKPVSGTQATTPAQN